MYNQKEKKERKVRKNVIVLRMKTDKTLWMQFVCYLYTDNDDDDDDGYTVLQKNKRRW